MMILVTCAGGQTGRAIVEALAAAGQPVRAMVRGPSSVSALEAMGRPLVLGGAQLGVSG